MNDLTVALATACLLATAVSLHSAETVTAESAPPGATHWQGRQANGAAFAVDMPAQWNGTLLLYARGFSPVSMTEAPATAPRDLAPWLLEHGYALAASNYSGTGWALAEAPGDQIDVLDLVRQRFGKPRRTIAWGNSMGGLTSLAIAEKYPQRVDAALPMCGSVSGSLGMLNTALDGAFAFRTLLAPDSTIRVADVDDDMANAARVRQVLEAAWQTPQGRARVILAATLAQLPPWTDPASPEPGPHDSAAQAEQLRKSFVAGVFLPRTDQEHRAGGVYSWNTGIDYRRQLRASGRADFVRAAYRVAGLSLDADLAALDAAPRIAADGDAVAYMRANFVPGGRLRIPVLTLHSTGDGLTVPATHGSLARSVGEAGATAELSQVYVRGAGHCVFTAAEQLSALRALEQRLDSGRWRTDAGTMNDSGEAFGGKTRFVPFHPAPLLRHCGVKAGSCPGEPPARTASAAVFSR